MSELTFMEAMESAAEPDKPHPTWDQIRTALQKLALDRGEWAGYPLPIRGLALAVESRFPYQALNNFFLEEEEEKKEQPNLDVDKIISLTQSVLEKNPKFFEQFESKFGEHGSLSEFLSSKNPDKQKVILSFIRAMSLQTRKRFVNSWYSAKRHSTVTIYKVGEKRIYEIEPCYGGPKLDLWLNTLIASDAWTPRMEERALEKLKSLLNERAYNSYLLTGTFIETSKKSKVTYMFRKLRPTVAMVHEAMVDRMKVLSVLCLHPLAYYQRSFAGVHCPTDDVICHLIMMRGDEKLFWKKANHHELYDPEAGL
jgi:hypothetical protein